MECNEKCDECKPIDCDEYFKLSEQGKNDETERAICRAKKHVNKIVYGT